MKELRVARLEALAADHRIFQTEIDTDDSFFGEMDERLDRGAPILGQDGRVMLPVESRETVTVLIFPTNSR